MCTGVLPECCLWTAYMQCPCRLEEGISCHILTTAWRYPEGICYLDFCKTWFLTYEIVMKWVTRLNQNSSLQTFRQGLSTPQIYSGVKDDPPPQDCGLPACWSPAPKWTNYRYLPPWLILCGAEAGPGLCAHEVNTLLVELHSQPTTCQSFKTINLYFPKNNNQQPVQGQVIQCVWYSPVMNFNPCPSNVWLLSLQRFTDKNLH